MNKAIYLGIALIGVTFLVLSFEPKLLARQNTSTLQPITWYEGLSISFSLKELVDIKKIDDVSVLLDAQWYSNQDIYAGPNAEQKAVIASCRDYLKIRGKGYTPLQSNAAGPFMNIAMKCSAIEALSQARPANKSWVNTLSFDQSLPKKLPKQMAFFSSTSDHKRMLQNNALKTLADVYQSKLIKQAEYTAEYQHSGGVQEIALVGRGDINHDGVEDILLLVMNRVSGGSFTSTHLYALTRYEYQDGFVLLKEYPY